MKPAILAAGVRLLALSILTMIPLLTGRALALALDDPLLGAMAGLLVLIPLMMAFCPRPHQSRRRADGRRFA
jgi:hypothetical protein